jgi:hypothetical protein
VNGELHRQNYFQNELSYVNFAFGSNELKYTVVVVGIPSANAHNHRITKTYYGGRVQLPTGVSSNFSTALSVSSKQRPACSQSTTDHQDLK